MPRTNALTILQATSTPAQLQELYGWVIENIQKESISQAIKSQSYTGNPAAGSAEYKRFANSQAKAYGTARTAAKGDVITAPPITVNLDQHKEIVEEVAKFDLDTFGVGNILARRVGNHVDTLVWNLDTEFFTTMGAAATAVTTAATAAKDRLTALVQTLEKVQNSYVRGVPRNIIEVVANGTFYDQIRDYLDTAPNANVDTAAYEFGYYHGIRVFNSINVPTGVDAIAQAKESVAQPVVLNQYGEPEKIQLSNNYAVSLFYDYGTKVLAPDLVFKLATPS